MKTPTGRAIVEAITQLLERENRAGQEAKQIQTIKLLGVFVQAHGIPVQSGAVSTLSRLLRKLEDPDAFRQIRSMSDSLLNMEELELKDELVAIRDRLMRIEAPIHQAKTKAAFVSTMLRPFSPKYTSIWFQERDDIDVEKAKAHIERLEEMKLKSMADLSPWARGVAEIFEQVVVYRGEDAADLYARPTGTVSDKSSKTYLQAWNSFFENFRDKVWSGAGGSVVDDEKVSSAPRAPRGRSMMDILEFENDDLPGLDQDSPKGYQESFSMMMAPPSDSSKIKFMKAPPRSKTAQVEKTSPVAKAQASQWIQIFIESKLDSSAQATRKWESQADFTHSLQKWLDTLPVIWGDAADQFVAKVSVKTASGESDLTLPSLTVKDAAARLTKAVEMQQD
jgi:hypothetical protein